ncbi:MAG TPA: hypothetical protein PK883_07240 [Anaerolineaceae bacterium]|nr:hypothetical protein [Anaerolineaceae bacterium]
MNSSLSVFQIILLILLALTNLSPTRITGWSLIADGFDQTPVFVHIRENQFVLPETRSRIGKDDLCVGLVEQRAVVSNCKIGLEAPLWQSPPEWQVEQAFFSDLNWDNERELTLLVWRPFEPWPVDRFMPSGGRINSFHDKDDKSCHLILVKVEGGSFRELWAGSALAAPLHSLIAADLDGDNRQELTALEYSYNEKVMTGSLVVWRWNGFGFSLEARQEGDFSSLEAIRSGKNVFLIAQ